MTSLSELVAELLDSDGADEGVGGGLAEAEQHAEGEQDAKRIARSDEVQRRPRDDLDQEGCDGERVRRGGDALAAARAVREVTQQRVGDDGDGRGDSDERADLRVALRVRGVEQRQEAAGHRQRAEEREEEPAGAHGGREELRRRMARTLGGRVGGEAMGWSLPCGGARRGGGEADAACSSMSGTQMRAREDEMRWCGISGNFRLQFTARGCDTRGRLCRTALVA
ncbi:unnamed protein product [Chondrus crispus]|uniref:Uncharacterized protein n=1 Tax=Chondrus crispus TaxID=2769 RepID=R7QLD0_CHOCR|nr:unnamed protein product [Chondrus crispus]CDF38563.1 unnamed protein product [Chondrus crispus]|eukprot:XP_005718468.1 unnamed protein product [Chondrus crispus]